MTPETGITKRSLFETSRVKYFDSSELEGRERNGGGH